MGPQERKGQCATDPPAIPPAAAAAVAAQPFGFEYVLMDESPLRWGQLLFALFVQQLICVDAPSLDTGPPSSPVATPKRHIRSHITTSSTAIAHVGPNAGAGVVAYAGVGIGSDEKRARCFSIRELVAMRTEVVACLGGPMQAAARGMRCGGGASITDGIDIRRAKGLPLLMLKRRGRTELRVFNSSQLQEAEDSSEFDEILDCSAFGCAVANIH